MADKVYHIKLSRIILNVSIYLITIIPSYVILYEKNRLIFWSILILENIITTYLFNQVDLFEAIGEEAKPRDMMVLSVSVIISIGMFIGLCLKYSHIFWIIIITEIIFVIAAKILKMKNLK